jgi:hypothetical protein
MDMTMVESDAAVGEVATVFGGLVTLDQQAVAAGTISYELLTSLSPRVEASLCRAGRRERSASRGDHRARRLGCGAAPDTPAYGDAGAIPSGMSPARRWARRFPNLERLGLGRCAPIRAVPRCPHRWRRTAPGAVSPGKDSTTGHWELCGLVLPKAFATYPLGFPTSLIAEFSRRTGRGVLGNRAASAP